MTNINAEINDSTNINATVTDNINVNATITGYANKELVNIGTGENIYAGKNGSNQQLKSLKAGSNINLNSTNEDITINVASSLKYESFTLRVIDLSNKYVEIAGTITDNQSIRVFVDNVGIKAEQGIDYSVSGNQIFWQGFEFDGLLEEGDTLNIFYIGDN